MLGKKMEKQLNDQVNAELYSGYLYLSMSAYFHSINLEGFANWMRIQAQEELAHAIKFYDFIVERGGTVALAAIEQPKKKWKSPLAAFENAYGHELLVSGRIDKLVDLAIKSGDHATNAFLQWFVAEQVQEEASADAVVQQIKLAGDKGGGLFMLDKEMGQRVFTPPAAE